MEAQRLKPESQVKIQEKRHAYQDLIRTLIDEGISEGSFRKVDSLLAARILLSSLAPVVFTNRPSKVSKDLVNETIEIFFKGIEK
jgi:TetR/AcrR family transcriptional regulator, cholesterol catabolism regulator